VQIDEDGLFMKAFDAQISNQDDKKEFRLRNSFLWSLWMPRLFRPIIAYRINIEKQNQWWPSPKMCLSNLHNYSVYILR
jgi:hypothetical protein